MPTKEQLEAENAALRELLGVIAQAADVPLPADPNDDNMRAHYRVSSRRADYIAVYAARIDIGSTGLTFLSLRARAKALREEIAKPLGYTPAGANVIAGDFGPEIAAHDHLDADLPWASGAHEFIPCTACTADACNACSRPAGDVVHRTGGQS